jgi:hypothetical protein
MRVTAKRLIFFSSLVMFASLATAETKTEMQSRYKDERAACHSAEDRQACLREAGAALREARTGKLDAGENFEQHKIARCASHNSEDRDYCLRRMTGEGTVTGSIEGGGVMRELRVPIAAEEAPAK